MQDKTRITVFVDGEHHEKLVRLTREGGLSKDALLASTLGGELNYLKALEPNGPKARRWFKAIGKVRQGNKRINITLDKSLADLISVVCDEKGISRDQFIGQYISFLVDGDPEESCVSPLKKVVAMLKDPRFEYYETNGGNPYEDLHLGEQVVDELAEMVRGVTRDGESNVNSTN